MIVTFAFPTLEDGEIRDEEVELDVDAVPREGEMVWLNDDDLRSVRYVVHHLDPLEGHRVVVTLTFPLPPVVRNEQAEEADVREALDKLLRGGVVYFDIDREFDEAQRLVDAASAYGAEARYEGELLAVYLRSRESDPREELDR